VVFIFGRILPIVDTKVFLPFLFIFITFFSLIYFDNTPKVLSFSPASIVLSGIATFFFYPHHSI
jgi:ABC-type Mn2+/Zn2+ transport system permease subunit